MKQLAGRVAVVTGAASGIGRALAAALVARGCSVALADVESPALAATLDELDAGPAAVGLALDVARPASWLELEPRIEKVFGRPPTLLCLNAGVSPSGPVLATSEATWRWLLDVNLFGVLNGLTTFGPELVRRGEGHVIITGSATGYVPTPGLSAYSAVKHAVHALAEMLRSELAGTGVGVSLICPGTVRTGIYRSERNRPAERPGPSHSDPTVLQRYQEAVDASPTTPQAVAAAAIDAVVADRFYVLPSPEVLPMLVERCEALGRALAADAAGEPRPGGAPVD